MTTLDIDPTVTIRDEIRDRLNLTDIAEGLGVKRRGTGWLCPFHPDRNPSFGITPKGYRCFGCGASGDAIGLVRALRGFGYRDALTYLAYGLGIPTPWARTLNPSTTFAPIQRDGKPAKSPDPFPAQRRFEVLTWSARQSSLTDHSPALDYLAGRGISPKTAMAAGVGYRGMSYGDFADRLKAQFSLEDLQGSGLLNDKGNLRLYRHRLLFPYWLNGEVLGLQARNTDWAGGDDPKEITIGPITIPFGADVLTDEQEEVVITEGCIDALSLREMGLVAVAIPGAENFKPAWVDLFDYAGEIILALDADDAGRRGASKIAALFSKANRKVRYMSWPDGIKDANEYLLSLTRAGGDA